MKKVLLISNMYPSKKYKHYGVFVRNTAEMLENGGYSVDTAALKKKDSKIGKLIGYSCFYLKAIFLAIFKHYDYLYAHYLSHTALLIKIIHKLKPSIKIVVNVHGNDVMPEDEHDKKFIPLVKDTLQYIDRCIVPSIYFKNIMIENYHLLDDQISIFPSGGVNKDIFYPQNDAKKQLGFDEDKMIIGYIGRYELKKGWELFVEAINLLNQENKLDNINVVMVGTGSQENEMDELINQYQLTDCIKKYPMQNQKELALFYSAMDVFCFPTYRESESLGLVGLEAMACGSIVIASNMAGPTSYMLDGENGYLFEPKNIKSLKDTIDRVINLNDSDKEYIKDKGYNTVKQYDSKNMENVLLDIFNKM